MRSCVFKLEVLVFQVAANQNQLSQLFQQRNRWFNMFVLWSSLSKHSYTVPWSSIKTDLHTLWQDAIEFKTAFEHHATSRNNEQRRYVDCDKSREVEPVGQNRGEEIHWHVFLAFLTYNLFIFRLKISFCASVSMQLAWPCLCASYSTLLGSFNVKGF